ncbi:tetratricopeptide repeat protein 38 isoform X2 [Eutrema salsugineum]|uniref:tetratricopeptide repeat protein 38 isoform X2 n=1 Tax=Eutrema salsugineum TaxID=72664 RepID=UPI000CED0DBA|nr:tetratricopeptide repeat protein 38 isoform X2 [Eutrema salsugineum]
MKTSCCTVTQDVSMSLKCMKEDESEIHEYRKGSRCVWWGYEVNTSSDGCIAAINSYSHQVLGYGRERNVILEAPLYDKDCVLGNILAAHYLSSSDIARANYYARAAESQLGKATAYEKEVFKAVNYLISENMDEDVALELHSKLLTKFPKDLLSWKRVEILCFYMGRPDLSLPLFEKILPENRELDYVYGMLAFPLLELGHLAEAEKAARKGYEINKNDSWAHHCLCHVLQTECRFKEAVEFMEECSASWDSCSSLRYSHNWWHVAVCYLEGGSPISKVQEIYDHQMCKELEKDDAVPRDVYLDALGLLLRLDTRDNLDEVLDRLKILAECLTDQEWLFDITTIWALSKVGNTSLAHILLEGLKSRVSKMSKKKQQLMQKAIQLAEAVYEYGKGNYKEALELLGPDFDAVDYKMIGASDLQMDVFNEIWYKLLLLTGQSSTASKVLERRIKERDGAPFLWRLLEKSYAMEGKTEAVVIAGEKAKALESLYFKFD